MPLPAVFDKASVHGKYVNLDGTVPTGTVRFVGGILLRATGVDTLILPSSFTVTLNASGEFTVLLPTTDDPDITPYDWQYMVTESFNTFTRTYYMEVPYDTIGTIQIADLEVPLGGNMAVERGRYVESIAGQVGTVPLSALGTGSANATTFLRGDGTWAVPAGGGGSGGVTDHGALTGLTGTDHHTQYLNNARGDARYLAITARGAASGVASLDASTRVPVAQLASGTPSNTVFLRGDGTWAVPAGSTGVSSHGSLTGLSADDHPQYLNNTRADARYLQLSARGTAMGVAALDGTARVPVGQLGSGTTGTTVFLRGDGVWATPPSGGSGGGVTDHGSLTGLTADHHLQYHTDARGDARYVLLTSRGAASGVASLNAGGTVPTAQLGTGTASTTTYLRGDGTWFTPAAADHQQLINRDDVAAHPQYALVANGITTAERTKLAGVATGATAVTTLNTLTNVNVPSPTDGQLLRYSTSLARWEASDPGTTVAAHTHSAADLTSGTMGLERSTPGTSIYILKFRATFGSVAGAWPTSRPSARPDIICVWVGDTDPGSIAIAGDQWLVQAAA